MTTSEKKTPTRTQSEKQPIPAKTKKKSGSAFFKYFRVIAGLSLLSILLGRVSPEEIVQLFKQTAYNWHLILLAYVFPGIGIVISALRLKILLSAQGANLPILQICRANLIGSFYNQVLPSTIGGDVARGYCISNVCKFNGSEKLSTKPTLLSFTVIGVDRFVGVIGILFTGLLVAMTNPELIRQSPGLESVLYIALLGSAFLASLLVIPARSIGRWLFSIPLLHKLRERAAMVYNALKEYRSSKQHLLAAFLLSLCLQFSIIAQYWILVNALELAIPFWGLAILVPIVSLISMIPITINGIGLRENTLYAIGGPMGLTVSGSVALAYTFLLAKILWAILGGILHFRTSKPAN